MIDSPEFIDAARELLDFSPETGEFRWKANMRGPVKKGDIAGTKRNDGYIRIKVAQQGVWAHRLAWAWVNGSWPKFTIDHINGNTSDNRISNLRDVEQQTNSQNRIKAGPRKNGGTLIGAYWCPTWKRWKSVICTNGKTKHIGWFNTEQEAHDAYLSAKRQLHKGCTI